MRAIKGNTIKRLFNELLKVAYWRYDTLLNTSSNFKILGIKLSADWPKSNLSSKYDLNRTFGI